MQFTGYMMKQEITPNAIRYVECMMKHYGNSIRLTAFEH